jgi:hypothetical protein
MIEIIGGPDRDRTDDLFHAMEARSQLRHRPTMTNLSIFVESARFVKRPRLDGVLATSLSIAGRLADIGCRLDEAVRQRNQFPGN